MMTLFNSVFRGRRVLVTGHTGFKGAWLCQWLLSLGAEVHGYALDPTPEALLFGQLRLAERLASDHRADLSDRLALGNVVSRLLPDFVFHLAAQPLVRLSYTAPVETFATNVMGTVHVLEAIAQMRSPCIGIMVTTDKCYENREWLHGYREEDAMGGYDPYSASKGAAEIAIASYRRSFFSGPQSQVLIASARAGNVIGGGDWAMDRIVPDCLRSIAAAKPIPVRNKTATRPWQHVLEPLSGYLQLAAQLFEARGAKQGAASLSSAFNFGPGLTSNRTVADLVKELLLHTGGDWLDASEPTQVHEASKLNLSTDKAFHLLGWLPVWNFETTVARTAQWYLKSQALEESASRIDITEFQIDEYVASAKQCGLRWASS